MRQWYKVLCAILVTLFSLNLSKATTYTAVASGDWSSPATWGGSSPGAMVDNGDIVVIPLTMNVDMDMDVWVNDASSSIQVMGAH